MRKTIGYDYGGAESPHSKSYTVVDMQPGGVVADLGQRGWAAGLPPKQRAFAGGVIRYLTPEGIANFAEGAAALLLNGGKFTVRDTRGCLHLLTNALATHGVYLDKLTMLNGCYMDPDWPEADWDYMAVYTKV